MGWADPDRPGGRLGRVALPLALCANACAPLSWADGAERAADPFFTANRSPVVALYGAPQTEPALLTRAGHLDWGVFASAANNFTVNDDAPGEVIVLDGETHQFTLRLRYGWRQRLEVGVDVPWISHESGRLDDFIDDWHDWFNLPEGERPDYPNEQLQYAYSNGAGTELYLDDSVSGLGDVRINAAYRLRDHADYQLSLRVGAELPTGDADELLGSESTDVHAGLYLSDTNLVDYAPVAFHGSMGLLAPGSGEVLPAQQKDWVAYGSAALAWGVSPRIQLKLQLDGHTAFYDSGLRELGDASWQLVMGGTAALSRRYLLDIYVSEDIVVDASPDVVFQLGLRTAY